MNSEPGARISGNLAPNHESGARFTIHGLTPCLVLILTLGGAAQEPPNGLSVGVRYAPATDPAQRQRDLEEMRRLRFTIIALPDDSGGPGVDMASIDRLLAGAPNARFRVESVATVAVQGKTSTGHVTLRAWMALAHGARRIVFDDWTRLQDNTDALTAAAEFADHMARNAALYAPLRPRQVKEDTPDVVISGSDVMVHSHVLESDEALVLIVTNSDVDQPRDVTMNFSPVLPEAIWQNMLTGAAVNFVAGPNGPVHSLTLEPQGVLVLMIRKRFR